MKTLFNLIFTCLIGISAQAENSSEFECENNMFREAVLRYGNGTLFIQDNHILGANEINKIVEERLGTRDKIALTEFALEIPDSDTICSEPVRYMLNCTASSKRSLLYVRGHVYTHSGQISGTIDLTIVVKVKNLVLRSKLSSDGQPIAIVSSGGSVTLDRLFTETQAVLDLNGQEVSLTWDPFFQTKSCSSLN